MSVRDRSKWWVEYYRTHKKQIAASVLRYQRKYPERVGDQHRRWRTRSARGVYMVLRRSSRARNLPLLISVVQFTEWFDSTPKVCVYCGLSQDDLPKINDGMRRISHRLSIDRMNNELPYQEGNLAFACLRCNVIKANFFTYEDMKQIGERFVQPKWQSQLSP